MFEGLPGAKKTVTSVNVGGEQGGGTDLALSLELKQLVITQEGPPPLH